MAQKHEFALYVPDLSALKTKETIILTDTALITRMTSVLRLTQGETCILFDAQVHIRCTVLKISKKEIVIQVVEKKPNQTVEPHITCLLPLLKRDDLETALYSSVEMGATSVHLVLTEKVQRSWGDAKEFDRLRRIMIAAAEQSKNFALPILHAPQELSAVIETIEASAAKLFFDIDGKALVPMMQQLAQQKPQQIIMMVGPEGDLTMQEKKLLTQKGFVSCQLTPTVLRAASAYSLALGILRSCLK